MKSITPLLILSLALLSGCSTTQKATVVGNRITNPTVGFYGYEAPVPQGYQIADPSDTVGQKIISEARRTIHPHAFTSKLAGAHIRDEIILHNEENNSYISFIVVEFNIPGSLSQIPVPQFSRFKDTMERSTKSVFTGKFTEHFDLNSPYTIEFHGDTITGADPLPTSGYITFGKLNEMIAVTGYTANRQSNQQFENALHAMMIGTKIL